MKTTKQQAKEKIKALVDKYNKLTPDDIKKYNEANTRKNFILPLFDTLGWDTKGEEVVEEERASGKRVDYAFKMGGITKFFLEAKPLSIDLDEPKWADQAIWYAWHKSIPWVVLTDFESIKIFNAEWDTPDPESSKFFEIPFNKYLDDFEQIWWLSKESFEKGILDSEALKWGKKPKRIAVDKQLSKDLINWRDILFRELQPMNSFVPPRKLAESIQRILDRLIFIRAVEDRGIEDTILLPLVRSWVNAGRPTNKLLEGLKNIFRKFDDYYDSRLFEIHHCDQIKAIEGTFERIINELYKTGIGIRYNFDHINADVLGSIYEQYLGHIQKEEKENGGDGKTKRKSQGIYYTPRYIVDYIVQNTLGEILKTKNTEQIKNLRILDPACGSGSFLIRAYEELINYRETELNKKSKFKKWTHLGMIEKTIKQKIGQGTLSSEQKMDILRNNIYGIDLDEEAVEIAQLNLLLKTVDKRAKLPSLQHILCGNSLISGDEKELKKYFGKKWRDKKPFNWQEKLPEVFKQGGFDIVIGNPPYLKEMDNKEVFEPIKKTEYRKYYQGKMDFWYFFLHRAIDVAKGGWLIGFITNSYFLKSAGASKFIERIKNELVLIKAVDLSNIKVFGDVSGRHIIHIYQKRQATKNDKTILVNVSNGTLTNVIDEKNKKEIPYQKLFTDNKINFEFTATPDFKNCIPLGELYDVSQGVVEATSRVSKSDGDGVFVLNNNELRNLELNNEEKKIIKKYLNTNDVDKYIIRNSSEYLIYSDKAVRQKIASGSYPHIKSHLDGMKKFITSSNKPYGLHRPREVKYFKNPKLICKEMFLSPEFCYDENDYFVGFSFSVITQKDKDYSLKYLLGILNSRLAKNWFNINGKKRGVGVDIGVLVFRKFPVYKANKSGQFAIEKLVDKMLDLNKKLQKLHPVFNEEEYNEIKLEIEKTDKEIDQKVYKLYGLTEEEIKIIEK